jgi:Bacteriophage minor capsid protein
VAFLNDIITLLETGAVGTGGVNIFATSKAAIPLGDGPYASVAETGGTNPDYVQNAPLPAYLHPTAQLTFRAKTYQAAEAMAQAAWDAITGVQNQTVNGVWYLSIRPMQSILDRGLDDLERPMVGFNVIAEKHS